MFSMGSRSILRLCLHAQPSTIRRLSLTSISSFQVKPRNVPPKVDKGSTPVEEEVKVSSAEIPIPLATSPVTPESSTPAPPVKRSLKEQIITFYKNMWRDYRDVFRDAYKEGKEKPWKSTLYMVLMGTMGYLIWSNPDEFDFDEECFQNRTKLSTVGVLIQNPISVTHVNNIEKLKMKGELRYQSLALFSVVWRHDNAECVGAFDATCSYLQPRLREARERLVDIGLAGRWWISKELMKDYDVNEKEWEMADLIKAKRILQEQQQQQDSQQQQ